MTGKVVVKRDYTSGTPTTKPKLNIGGGTFDVEWSVVKDEADITITGGNYTSAPDAGFVAENHVMIKYTKGQDGRYYVGAEDEIQAIADKAEAGDKIDVIAGEIDLKVNTPGVIIANTGGKVTVNGAGLDKGASTTIPEVKDPTKPSDGTKTDSSANTGDDFNMIAAGAAALAAIIVMAAVAVTGRRHRQR